MQIKDKKLYYVGGVVRDEILGTKSFDTDFCYEGNAIEFSQNLNVIKINPDFGTVRIKSEDGEIDIASTRTESYPHAGHLPVIDKIGCSLKEDLKRRDFTINAMAKNTVTGEITDYFGGLKDIRTKKLRVLHDRSFIEDPTRIIRGIKFAVRFGFELDKHTKELQDKYLDNINYDMSYHRLKKELVETFNLNIKKAYTRFIEQNAYKLLGENQTVPKLKGSACNLIKEFKPDYPWIVYLGLFDLTNLELTSKEKAILEKFNEIKSILPKEDIEIYKLFRNIPKESVMLYALSTDYTVGWNYLERLNKIKIETTGDDLLNLGIPQGKVYNEIFEYLTKARITNPKLTAEEELNLIKERFL